MYLLHVLDLTFYNLGSRLDFEKDGGDSKRSDPRFKAINKYSNRDAKKL